MAKITLKGNPVNTSGDLPSKGSAAPDFSLVKSDLGTLLLSELKGKKLILNIFPSLDTSVCATSGKVIHTQLVHETTSEPDYDSALNAL